MSIFMYPLNNLKKIIFIYEQCLRICSLPSNRQNDTLYVNLCIPIVEKGVLIVIHF